MPLSIGTAVASNGGNPRFTFNTVGSSGVLVYVFIANTYSGTNTVSSSSLGTWEPPRAQSAGANPIIVWTKPFTASLSSESIVLTGFGTVTFFEAILFEINGCPTSAYFDTNGVLPVVTSTADPISISTSAANTIIFAGFKSNNGSPPPGSGWTQVVADTNNLLVEYQIVSAPQSGLSATVGGIANGQSTACYGDAIVVAGAVGPPPVSPIPIRRRVIRWIDRPLIVHR